MILSNDQANSAMRLDEKRRPCTVGISTVSVFQKSMNVV